MRTMKKMGAAFILLGALVVFLGVIDPDLVKTIAKIEERERVEAAAAAAQSKKNRADEDEYSLAMIMNMLLCEEEDAQKILNGLHKADMAFPLTVAVKDPESNNLYIYDSNYAEYYVTLGKDYSVYLIKDVQENRIIYALNE